MDALVIKDPATGRRIAAAWNELDAESKLAEMPERGRGYVVERVRVSARREDILNRRRRRARLNVPAKPKRERPMRFYDADSAQYCRDCRDNLLTNAWRIVAGGSVFDGSAHVEVMDMPPLRPRDFTALGDRPWAGNEPGERYFQCDECCGQWGPDA